MVAGMGGMRDCQVGHAWLAGGLVRGWQGGGCAWLAGGCMVAGGRVWLPGACMVARGHVWLPGGMHV